MKTNVEQTLDSELLHPSAAKGLRGGRLGRQGHVDPISELPGYETLTTTTIPSVNLSEESVPISTSGRGRSVDVISVHGPQIISDRGRPEGRGGGPPSGMGSGGGHTETAGNNLSFPVIFTDGGTLALAGEPDAPVLTTPYDLNGDGVISSADTVDGYYQFPQKTEGNMWQADSVAADGAVFVSTVDWGDSMEAVDMKVGRPVRVELSFYKDLNVSLTGEAVLPESMTSYPMTMLANPSSPNEIQGAGASSYPIDGTLEGVHTEELSEATVYIPDVSLVIQPLVGTREDVAEGDLLWNGEQWVDGSATDPTDIGDPLTGLVFGSEVNVGGKVIYGLSKGGWRPSGTGDYRITVSLPLEGSAKLEHATILPFGEEEGVTLAAEDDSAPDMGGGTGVVVPDANLTYIDIRVTTGGGGGGGHRGGGRGYDLEPISLGMAQPTEDPFLSDSVTATELFANPSNGFPDNHTDRII